MALSLKWRTGYFATNPSHSLPCCCSMDAALLWGGGGRGCGTFVGSGAFVAHPWLTMGAVLGEGGVLLLRVGHLWGLAPEVAGDFGVTGQI